MERFGTFHRPGFDSVTKQRNHKVSEGEGHSFRRLGAKPGYLEGGVGHKGEVDGFRS